MTSYTTSLCSGTISVENLNQHALRPEPNPRVSYGVRSPPAQQHRVRAFQSALPATGEPTAGASAAQLLQRIRRATGTTDAPQQLCVAHVRTGEVSTPALEYAALYLRHVAGDARAATDIAATRSVCLRPGAAPGAVPREVRNCVETPVVALGETVAVVEWPPPPRLASANLAGYVYKNAAAAFLHIDEPPKEDAPVEAAEEDAATPANGSVSAPGKGERNAEGVGDSAENGQPETTETMESTESSPCEAEREEDTPEIIFIAPYTLDNEEEKCFRKYSLLLATLGTQETLVTFAAEILEWSAERFRRDKPERNYFGLYRLKKSHWIHEEDRRARKISSVFLPSALRMDLVDDAHRFFSDATRGWYNEFGIPYRRAYLFHGPPGTGKTSMIKALASDLRRNCCFVSMMHALAPEDFADALACLPSRPMLVIEDVDALFRAVEEQTKMTFSALLNVLDGMMSADGVLTVMTTNHVTRIDPIALRAGRVDRLFFFGPAEDDILRECFRYFYKGTAEDVVERFVAVVRKERDVKARSIATLQEHFIEMREKTAEECVESLPTFMKNYVNRAALLKQLEDKFKEDTGTDGKPFMLDGENVNKYAETEDNASRPKMFL